MGESIGPIDGLEEVVGLEIAGGVEDVGELDAGGAVVGDGDVGTEAAMQPATRTAEAANAKSLLRGSRP